METLNVNSLIKVITSGNIPTTSNLLKGEIAYGVIAGENKIYGNNGTTILDFAGKIYTAGTGIAISGTNVISTDNVPETALATALQTKINNVLFKDGTTAFTPTGDYNPATKKYVDDAMAAVMEVANGKTKAYVFDTAQDLEDWLAGTFVHPDGYLASELNIGDLMLVRDNGAFDYWWDGTEALPLEGKVDLTSYMTISAANAKFVENVTLDVNAGLSRIGVLKNSATTYTNLPLATNVQTGVISLAQAPANATLETAGSTVSRYYPINTTLSGVAYVNVPWTDSAATGTALTPAANQPISVGGTASAVTTVINSTAVVANKGLKVDAGQITLDPANIEIVFTVVEI